MCRDRSWGWFVSCSGRRAAPRIGYAADVRSIEVVIPNPSGLHARPATLFTQQAARFEARITVENLDRGKGPVDAKSLLMLLTAGVSHDHRIRLSAVGTDEDAAIDALVELIESGLGETPSA